MIEYAQTSRYYHITENPDLVQTDLVNLNLPFSTTTVRVTERNRPELIAQRIYNNPNYWWVICMFNGIQDPTLLPAGLVLKCPVLDKSPRE